MPYLTHVLRFHLEATQNGMVLMILGLLWSRLNLSPALRSVAYVSAQLGKR